ncbi:YdeI/OmpD-associated family protein [Candidatus Saccharibacteria bacterium]|nr:YdeI/OmpD-associated family protein [Candidatus Saccharibacteria bacterium]
MATLFEIPIMTCKDAATWETWVSQNYTDQKGVWLKVAKKNSGFESVSVLEALDVCLCYGWIDGQRRAYDSEYYLQKYTPRRKKSLWSQVNIGKIKRLTDAGRMKKPGIAAVEEAKADGRWAMAYASQREATEPEDLLLALEASTKANDFYATLTRAEKYSVLWKLMTAKTPQTRATQLQKMIEWLEREQVIQ